VDGGGPASLLPSPRAASRVPEPSPAPLSTEVASAPPSVAGAAPSVMATVVDPEEQPPKIPATIQRTPPSVRRQPNALRFAMLECRMKPLWLAGSRKTPTMRGGPGIAVRDPRGREFAPSSEGRRARLAKPAPSLFRYAPGRSRHVLGSLESGRRPAASERDLLESEPSAGGRKPSVKGSEESVDENEESLEGSEESLEGSEESLDGNEESLEENEDRLSRKGQRDTDDIPGCPNGRRRP
jgi:hypothetical protein